MGEYRDLINHTIRTYNTYAHYYTKRGSFGTEALFSLSEIQVIEYILENEEENLPMVEVARRLGLSASSFSRGLSLAHRSFIFIASQVHVRHSAGFS